MNHLNKSGCAATIIAVALILVLSFFTTAGILRLICWAFKWTWWSWKISFGIWLGMALISSLFPRGGKK